MLTNGGCEKYNDLWRITPELFPVLIPPSGGGVASGVDLGHDGLVVLLVDSHRIAAALEEDDEIEAACNIGGTLVLAEELAEEVVELLLGLGLEELEKHAGRGLLNNQLCRAHVGKVVELLYSEGLTSGHQGFVITGEAWQQGARTHHIITGLNLLDFHKSFIFSGLNIHSHRFTTAANEKGRLVGTYTTLDAIIECKDIKLF